MEEQVEVPKPKKAKSYACTPRQLEALKKAREAKRLRALQSAGNRQVQAMEEPELVEDMRQVQHSDQNSPVPVVRDDKLLKEFLEAEQIDALETGLGRRRRDEPRGLERLRESLPDFDGIDVNLANGTPGWPSAIALGLALVWAVVSVLLAIGPCLGSNAKKLLH